MNKNTHVNKLPKFTQIRIKKQLKMLGMFNEDIELLMNSKVRDIEDYVDISELEVC